MPNLIDNYKKVSQQIDAYTTYIDSKDASKTARKQAQFFLIKKYQTIIMRLVLKMFRNL